MNTLIFIRHGESEWNAQNRFTGRADPGLTLKGIQQSYAIGRMLLDSKLIPTSVFTSSLLRARTTTKYLLDAMDSTTKVVETDALVERDYGHLTGMNRDKAIIKFGWKQVQEWRRSPVATPPGGESLIDTSDRTWPCLRDYILPATLRGGVCLVVAHGNSIRSLIMQLETWKDPLISRLTVDAMQPMGYALDSNGRIDDSYNLNAYPFMDSLENKMR